MISERAQKSTPDITDDSEQPSLPSEGRAIEAMRDLFLPEEEDEAVDIIKIIQTCLKDVGKNNSKHAIKMLLQLIAVSEYIKLCARYKTFKACKQPCLKCYRTCL